jgi:diguanylate cyclase (GGDEF)-like protein
VTRLNFFHERALSTLEGVLERAARAHGLDSATGLATRRPFHDRLSSLVAASANDASLVVGVIFIDVDKLKQINDTRGHQAGDRALASIGGIVREAVRTDCGLDVVTGGPPSSEAVGRQGGDEFVVALRLITAPTLDDVAQRIKSRADNASLQRQHGYTGPPELTVSVGGVAYQSTPACQQVGSNSIATALLGAADEMMYRGKRDGHIHLATARFEPQLNLVEHRRLAPAMSQPAAWS